MKSLLDHLPRPHDPVELFIFIAVSLVAIICVVGIIYVVYLFVTPASEDDDEVLIEGKITGKYTKEGTQAVSVVPVIVGKTVLVLPRVEQAKKRYFLEIDGFKNEKFYGLFDVEVTKRTYNRCVEGGRFFYVRKD